MVCFKDCDLIILSRWIRLCVGKSEMLPQLKIAQVFVYGCCCGKQPNLVFRDNGFAITKQSLNEKCPRY